MKTLKRLAREDKRPNLELLFSNAHTYASVAEGVSLLSESELERVGDLTCRMMHSEVPFEATLKKSIVDRLLAKNNFALQIALTSKYVSANLLTELLSHPKQPLSYVPNLLMNLDTKELNTALHGSLVKFLELSRDTYYSEQNKKDKQYNQKWIKGRAVIHGFMAFLKDSDCRNAALKTLQQANSLAELVMRHQTLNLM